MAPGENEFDTPGIMDYKETLYASGILKCGTYMIGNRHLLLLCFFFTIYLLFTGFLRKA